MRSLFPLLLLLSCSLLASCSKKIENSNVSEEFATGWYDPESNQEDQWRWASDKATIFAYNETGQKQQAVIKYDILSLAPRSMKVSLNGVDIFTSSVKADQWIPREIALSLAAGLNTLAFDTDEPGVTPEGDTRDLRFCLRNFTIDTPQSDDGSLVLDPVASQVPQTFGEGWYELESNESSQWRWATSEASIALVNKTAQPKRIEASYDIRSLSERSVQIKLNGLELSNHSIIPSDWASKTTEFTLLPGLNTLTLNTSEPSVVLPGDERRLSFCLRNFKLRIKPQEQETPDP